jgi:hypothetical protein
VALDTDARTQTGSPSPTQSPDADRLRIYLADHRAGADAGSARARRFAKTNADSYLRDAASGVCRQIEEDVRTLDAILDRLGCRPSRLKGVLARTAELIGRLKPNGQVRGYSPLSRLLEMELLIAGILTKESLWQSLAILQQQRSDLSGFDFDALQHRALQQRMQLEAHRARTVTEALLAS